ncbi:MAG: aldose epimerase [Cyanobacteria bacterium P01_D01_bin.123]
MFSITSSSDVYTTYTLRDSDAGSSVNVVPERGGMVTTASFGNRDVFYLDAERFTHPELSVRGGIPFLFPICGNLPDNQYEWKGRTYELKQHGFGRTLPWQVANREISDNGAALTVALTDTPETFAVYPFQFEVRLTYVLQGNTLTIDQEYRNKSAEKMPFSYGFHPYFAAPNKTNLEFDLPSTSYFDRANQASGAWPERQWNFDLEEIDAAFEALPPADAVSTVVRDRHLQLGLTMTMATTCSRLVFWTLKGKPFYCLEPWSAPRNAINTGTDLTTLEPGDTHCDRLVLAWKTLDS